MLVGRVAALTTWLSREHSDDLAGDGVTTRRARSVNELPGSIEWRCSSRAFQPIARVLGRKVEDDGNHFAELTERHRADVAAYGLGPARGDGANVLALGR